MKRSLLLSLSALLLSACASKPCPKEAPVAARAPALAADGTPRVAIDGVEIEKVAFRAGVSSATVEGLAKQQACRGGYGAGLLTTPGPVEVYRMACDNGKVFMAKCELRQCRRM
jgi:hypothetical protein